MASVVIENLIFDYSFCNAILLWEITSFALVANLLGGEDGCFFRLQFL